MFKNFPKEYLAFTRKERNGIYVIIVLILLFSAAPFLYPLFTSHKKVDAEAFKKEIAALKIQEDSTVGYKRRNYANYESAGYYQREEKKNYTVPRGELFYFDPNTLSTEGWQRLGVKDKTIGTIQNYLTKGGKFRKPEDIGKIWGLHDDEVKRLIPFVSIAQSPENAYKENKTYEKRTFEKTSYKPVSVEINTADTSAFIALPGIGSKLAARIIAFREKLGGFYSIGQVAETWALPDSTFQKIKPLLFLKGTGVKLIHINSATLDEMKNHPYIRYAIANAIIQYRGQHGKFAQVGELKKIMAVTDEVYEKLAPYLTIE